jgi:hypothetical protein
MSERVGLALRARAASVQFDRLHVALAVNTTYRFVQEVGKLSAIISIGQWRHHDVYCILDAVSMNTTLRQAGPDALCSRITLDNTVFFGDRCTENGPKSKALVNESQLREFLAKHFVKPQTDGMYLIEVASDFETLVVCE